MLEAGYIDLYGKGYQTGFEIRVSKSHLGMLSAIVKNIKTAMLEE